MNKKINSKIDIIENELNLINEKIWDLSIYSSEALVNHNYYARKNLLENNLNILTKLKDLFNSINWNYYLGDKKEIDLLNEIILLI